MYYWAYKLKKCKILANNKTKEVGGMKHYWTKEISPDGKSDTQEQIKRIRNDKQELIFFISLILSSLKAIKLH